MLDALLASVGGLGSSHRVRHMACQRDVLSLGLDSIER
jgi:hypothetical protein